jgi:hypothetical protein
MSPLEAFKSVQAGVVVVDRRLDGVEIGVDLGGEGWRARGEGDELGVGKVIRLHRGDEDDRECGRNQLLHAFLIHSQSNSSQSN